MCIRTFIKIASLLLNMCITTIVNAAVYEIQPNSNIIGETKKVELTTKGTLFDVARQFDMGLLELQKANPQLKNGVLPIGTQIVIPGEFILPPTPYEGIVLNLAELRIYFFHPNSNKVSTYPVAVGRSGWRTPLGTTKIIKKREHPSWYPPNSIRNSYAAKGKILPEYIPPGPRNPLGNYAMNLAWNGYLIHGTNQPTSVGLRSSSGCIRMYPEDIKSLFHEVAVDTVVRFIHEPYKVGIKNNELYLEAHPPLQEPYYKATRDRKESTS